MMERSSMPLTVLDLEPNGVNRHGSRTPIGALTIEITKFGCSTLRRNSQPDCDVAEHEGGAGRP